MHMHCLFDCTVCGLLLQVMMDRQKKDELPKMQVGFIDAICAPLYKELFELHPPLQPLYDGVMNNSSYWQELGNKPKSEEAEVLCVYILFNGGTLMHTMNVNKSTHTHTHTHARTHTHTYIHTHTHTHTHTYKYMSVH